MTSLYDYSTVTLNIYMYFNVSFRYGEELEALEARKAELLDRLEYRPAEPALHLPRSSIRDQATPTLQSQGNREAEQHTLEASGALTDNSPRREDATLFAEHERTLDPPAGGE